MKTKINNALDIVEVAFPEIDCDCPYCGEWQGYSGENFEDGRYLESIAFGNVDCLDCGKSFQIDILKP